MKILHISDTHSNHILFPKDIPWESYDLIIHSGDCSNFRRADLNEAEVWAFIEWYSMVPCKNKIYVAGNHDTSIEKRVVKASDFTNNSITYLENESVNIDGFNIWGSPYTPTFGEWSFMKDRSKINRVWEQIPEGTDILVTHGPPKGVRDLSYDRQGVLEQCGDSALMKAILRIKPKLICFGHIHDMDSVNNQGLSVFSKYDGIFSNGACVTDGKIGVLSSYGNIINLEDKSTITY
jgi:Icc-related predicted phosphoesterase